MIILTLMIKNEEQIILRCIKSALPVIDAILISDTGSTDNTISVLTEFFSTLSIPTKIVHDPWESFGINRTNSFRSTVSWAEEMGWSGYALAIDADMILRVESDLVKDSLTMEGYTLQQRTPSIEYSNLRLLKLSTPWKCIGVTHEYWGGGSSEFLKNIYIEDVGDGGCKQDKFTRDEMLLKKGLEDEPDNVRYMFYYAQTLKDLGKLEEAIQWYKKRWEAGGWIEERWYSLYQVSRIYAKLDQMPEMEYWCLKAYELHPRRMENIYFVLKTFRERRDHFKAWHYYKLGVNVPKPSDGIFVEKDVYTYLFHYEKTILNYYVHPKEDFLHEMVSYTNKYNDYNWNNLQFYVHKVTSFNVRPLYYPIIDEYTPSSISLLKMSPHYLLNIRYVNYRIDPTGSYLYPPSIPYTHTRNFSVLTDSHFNPIRTLTEMKCEEIDKYGVEDLRLFIENKRIRWFGSSPDYPRINMICGTYNLETNRLEDRIHVKSPTQSRCEKNWIPIRNKCIYRWYPYTVGTVLGNEYTTEITQETPTFFKYMSGSSNVVEYNGSIYTMTHVVIRSSPRKYYHCMMKINPITYLIEGYTLPFYFIKSQIEYCLGIELCDDILSVFISQNDTAPTLVEIHMKELDFMSL
jgi:glycosyltransferase involved in cell wall biosynthesis